MLIWNLASPTVEGGKKHFFLFHVKVQHSFSFSSRCLVIPFFLAPWRKSHNLHLHRLMSSHLSMNVKPIPGLLVGVIAHTLSFTSHMLLYSLSIPASQFLSLNLFLPSVPCKLDFGNITMPFTLFSSLWPNCLVFQDHWALFRAAPST